jgi:hypothetical protein
MRQHPLFSECQESHSRHKSSLRIALDIVNTFKGLRAETESKYSKTALRPILDLF